MRKTIKKYFLESFEHERFELRRKSNYTYISLWICIFSMISALISHIIFEPKVHLILGDAIFLANSALGLYFLRQGNLQFAVNCIINGVFLSLFTYAVIGGLFFDDIGSINEMPFTLVVIILTLFANTVSALKKRQVIIFALAAFALLIAQIAMIYYHEGLDQEGSFIAIGCLILGVTSSFMAYFSFVSSQTIIQNAEHKAQIIQKQKEAIEQQHLKINEYNSKLEGIVAERTKALEQSNHELMQFAYIASHDLKEPLRMMTSFMGLIERELRKSNPSKERISEFMKIAKDGGKRMDRLITDLLAYSRINTRKQPHALVDLNRVLGVVKMNLQVLLSETNGVIEHGQLPIIKGNRMQMVQLFQNLLGNALKYRKKDVPPIIKITTVPKGDAVHFYIKDNGIGIDPKYHQRIFIAFQRLERSNEAQGTGIGLAICKKIVEAHGGTISVESTVGEGATFIFNIAHALNLEVEKENPPSKTSKKKMIDMVNI